jgi:proline racemase
MKVDVAYGGMIFAIVDAQKLGFKLEPCEARALADLGEKIRLAAREQVPVAHPELPDIHGVSIVQFAGPVRREQDRLVGRNTCIVAPGRSDRSPTGTGTCARMAVLHARGELKTGEGLTHESLIGSRFVGIIRSETKVGGLPAILPTIEGRAWVTGFHHYVVDPTDPWPDGYRLSDTWGTSDTATQF